MKKGFTLIELLAVIVILAIIAVIAVPIVLNIIDESKDNATLRSAEFYLEAVDFAIANRVMNYGEIPAKAYPIMKSGNICLEEYNEETGLCTDNNENPDDNELIVEVNGEKPSTGTIVIGNGQIENEITENGTTRKTELVIGNNRVVRNEKSELVLEEQIIEEDTAICKGVTTATKGTVPQGNYVPGDEYECEVKEGTKYNFFVLSTNKDTDGNIESVNLILNSNVAKTEWINKTDYLAAGGIIPEETYNDGSQCQYGDLCAGTDKGPVTAEIALYNATFDWDNITIMHSLYNSSYVKVNDGKARLPEYNEVNSVLPDNIAPSWLITSSSDNFWVSIGYGSPGGAGAYYISLDMGSAMTGADGNSFGIRPVITVPKNQIS